MHPARLLLLLFASMAACTGSWRRVLHPRRRVLFLHDQFAEESLPLLHALVSKFRSDVDALIVDLQRDTQYALTSEGAPSPGAHLQWFDASRAGSSWTAVPVRVLSAYLTEHSMLIGLGVPRGLAEASRRNAAHVATAWLVA